LVDPNDCNYLEHQIIPKKGSPEREKALAQFFHTSTDIQKAILGEFLGKEANQPVLDAFIRHLNFAGVSMRDYIINVGADCSFPTETD
jgi:hypothetical protein